MSDETLLKMVNDGITRQARQRYAQRLLQFGIISAMVAIIVALVWI